MRYHDVSQTELIIRTAEGMFTSAVCLPSPIPRCRRVSTLLVPAEYPSTSLRRPCRLSQIPPVLRFARGGQPRRGPLQVESQ